MLLDGYTSTSPTPESYEENSYTVLSTDAKVIKPLIFPAPGRQ